ncbi:DUF1801 domain-containing protein [Paenibacillus tyrfis]|uniref:YdhG-like domain-containing protein n=1 Tax=Paenibacillus tyrfis TaxID=1501230 RepID=A0A081P0J1_9BACL|nr:DUF1801 domain-containing protein [Paenibacillus tyrfis]KEQ24214.1 hypothetical protein ET33_11015 [Paenibacillus tyrfis]
MSQEVIEFINAIKEPWQAEMSTRLREMILQTIPDVQERIQYKKPHFLKNGKYAAVISTSKDAVSFTIFNPGGLEFPEGQFDGPPERKTIKLRSGQAADYDQVASLLGQASASL